MWQYRSESRPAADRVGNPCFGVAVLLASRAPAKLLSGEAVLRNLLLLSVLGLAMGSAAAAESEPVSKADCDAVLTAEVQRLEDGFARTRGAWEQTVEQRFTEHAELTSDQMRTARATFNDLVTKASNDHVKAVALPSIYRMMLAVPQYDISVCLKRGEMQALGNQAIAGFLLKLTQLLPLVETSVAAAKIG